MCSIPQYAKQAIITDHAGITSLRRKLKRRMPTARVTTPCKNCPKNVKRVTFEKEPRGLDQSSIKLADNKNAPDPPKINIETTAP
jgi:hypothetical protein